MRDIEEPLNPIVPRIGHENVSGAIGGHAAR